MRTNATLIALLLAVNAHADGLVRLVSTNRTSGTGTLRPGAIFVATNSPISLYVGNAGSNAVLVGVESPASTGYVGNAVSGMTTNLTLLNGNTNSFTAYITNGMWKGVSTP